MSEPTANHLAMAIKAASDTRLCKFKHGCIIYDKKGNILSIGRNIPHYCPSYPSLLLHAEADAILKCNRSDLKNANLLVVRVSKNKLRNSKPCKHCMSLISEAGIKNVYYSDINSVITKLYI